MTSPVEMGQEAGKDHCLGMPLPLDLVLAFVESGKRSGNTVMCLKNIPAVMSEEIEYSKK